MALLRLWTAGLILAIAAWSVPPGVSENLVAESERRQGVAEEIVRKESHPILSRKKREWVWNSLYVEEEKPAPIPYKIGQVNVK